MSYVKTDDSNYYDIADAIRGLHEGDPETERYPPAEMVDYLSTEGAGLKPWNVRAGITIFGVTGTLAPKEE